MTAPRVTLGSTGLQVSRLGFGCYRVDDHTPAHALAMRQALHGGVNLLDTSTNYTDGASERCVGNVLAEQVAAGDLRRDEVVVVSKIGYVQGDNMDVVRARQAAGRAFPEVVEYMDGCWHCVHPVFLADQLDRSLARLRLPRLDVCLLHNPEYFFSDALHRGATQSDLPALRDEFYRRLREAFAYFETQVAAGRIGAYGVSSNTCTSAEGDSDATSLARMLAAAEAAGGRGHHFKVLQLPMNLIESGAVFERNSDGGTVLDLAAARDIGVLVNRPLNAIAGRHMMRFAAPLERQASPMLDPVLPPERRSESLSRKTLHVLASTPGVSCILLGMRRPAWVADALPVMSWPPLPPDTVRAAFEAFRAAVAT